MIVTVLVPRQGHEDVLALATLDALKSPNVDAVHIETPDTTAR